VLVDRSVTSSTGLTSALESCHNGGLGPSPQAVEFRRGLPLVSNAASRDHEDTMAGSEGTSLEPCASRYAVDDETDDGGLGHPTTRPPQASDSVGRWGRFEGFPLRGHDRPVAI
jgi:hypothetical protein